jgi:cytochrome c biogenesis protein CcdA
MSNLNLNQIGPVFVETEPPRKRWATIATFAVPGLLVIGLLFLIVSLRSGIETGVSNLTRLLPLGFAVAAGMVASVNPCGVLMLPSYALYQVGAPGTNESTGRRVARAVLVSAAATVGFVVIFAVVGAIITAGGRWLTRVFPFAGLLVGLAMAGLGVWLLVTRKTLGILAANRVKVARKRSIGNAFLFGISYAIGSLSCTLPIFLVVVGSAVAGDGLLASFGPFVGYALGMGIVLIAAIVGTALFQQAVSRWLNRAARYVHRISAMFLIGAGLYLVYYWLFVAGLAIA